MVRFVVVIPATANGIRLLFEFAASGILHVTVAEKEVRPNVAMSKEIPMVYGVVKYLLAIRIMWPRGEAKITGHNHIAGDFHA